MENENIRLNPFVYISETDIRFYLLVLIGIVMPSVWAFGFGMLIFRTIGSEITFFLRLIFTAFIIFLIPIQIYHKYIKFSEKIIKELKLKKFDKLDQCEYIKNLYKEFLSNVKQPTLMYQLFGDSGDAFTFGTKKHAYISIPGGLVKKFRSNIDNFRSIFLHEMGHIANKDVEKVNLAESIWQSFKFTLSIPLGIFLIFLLILSLNMIFWKFYYFFLASLAGREITTTEDSEMFLLGLQAAKTLGGMILYLILFLILVYVLRRQIIRLREFYADAKVLEWEKSPEKMIETLKESGGEHYLWYKILAKFHPNTDERIHVLKNNSILFTPSLWVAFNVGFFYGTILIESIIFNMEFSDFYWKSLGSGIKYQVPPIIIPFALVSIFIFPFLMLAVSSNLHKLLLKVVFIEKKDIISASTILSIITISLVFSLGLQSIAILWLPISVNSVNVENIKSWIFTAFYFSLTLIFLLIFGSILIKRSFSKKEAEKNFLIITVFSSVLYIVSRLVTFDPNLTLFEIPPNLSLVIIFFLIFSVVTFAIIKIKDKKLICPICSKKIEIVDFQSNCPNCQHNLYSWAIYSF